MRGKDWVRGHCGELLLPYANWVCLLAPCTKRDPFAVQTQDGMLERGSVNILTPSMCWKQDGVWDRCAKLRGSVLPHQRRSKVWPGTQVWVEELKHCTSNLWRSLEPGFLTFILFVEIPCSKDKLSLSIIPILGAKPGSFT